MTTILFTGYAPVHFTCFRPIHAALASRPGVEVLVSGGLRTKLDGETLYDTDGLYARFGLPPETVLTVEEIRERDVDVLFCANTKPIRPRSAGCSVQIFHGLSFRNRAVREANLEVDYHLMLGPYMVRAFQERGLLTADDPRVAKIGFPKTDALLDGSLDRASILRSHGLTGERPVVLYAPTGAHANSLETMGEALIARLKEADAFDLLVKPHDHPKLKVDWFARLAPLEDDHLRLVRAADVMPSLFLADLLITDASSVANEYALLDRPIVFADVPELLANAAAEDSRLDLTTWGRRGGTVAADPAGVVAAVDDGLAHPERGADVRRELVDDLFYNPGRATPAALAWLRTELGVG